MPAPVTEELVLERFDVSEVRLSEVDAAIAFAGGAGDGRGAWSLHHNLSVLARFKGKIVGAALYFDGRVGRPTLDVCVGRGKGGQESEEQVELLRRLAGVLVDKALLKLHSAGRCRFAIRVGGRTDPGRFWADALWFGRLTSQPSQPEEPDDAQTAADAVSSDPQAVTADPVIEAPAASEESDLDPTVAADVPDEADTATEHQPVSDDERPEPAVKSESTLADQPV